MRWICKRDEEDKKYIHNFLKWLPGNKDESITWR
jgi:hypothetical protein